MRNKVCANSSVNAPENQSGDVTSSRISDKNALDTASFIKGLAPDNTHKVIRVDDVGILIASDFALDVARGLVPGVTKGVQFGRNTDIDTGSAPETVWNGGGVYTGLPLESVAPGTLDVSSDNNNDTLAGTGARTVKLMGLGKNWEYQEETLNLSGTSPVTTQKLWRRSSAS